MCDSKKAWIYICPDYQLTEWPWLETTQNLVSMCCLENFSNFSNQQQRSGRSQSVHINQQQLAFWILWANGNAALHRNNIPTGTTNRAQRDLRSDGQTVPIGANVRMNWSSANWNQPISQNAERATTDIEKQWLPQLAPPTSVSNYHTHTHNANWHTFFTALLFVKIN